GRPLRAGSRHRARHRRQGHCEPDRGDSLGGDAAALLAQHGEGRRPDRARGPPGARAGASHRGHRRAGGASNRHPGDGRPDRARAGASVLMASGLSIAVVGATGAAGQTTLRILEERKFPVRELHAFASERSVGKTVTFRGEPITIRRIEPTAFKGVEIAFCSAGSAQSKEYAPMIVKAGATVIDKSNAFRMDPDVPLVIPEINAHAARRHRGILACPNCTTIVTVMPLKPLHDAGRLTRVIATSFQAVSGAGVNGIAELREQTLAWARGEAMVARHFPHQIAFNLVPAIDRFVGRIREDLSSPNGLSFWVVGDQLRKGAATNAVQIAELLLQS